MHDLVIRDATIVDGTGGARYTGDLAVDAGKLVQVGGKAGPGRREIEAAGRLATPGWVDVHTHYDGQATWDPVLAPSSWHGATTVVFGNCGVGFAPVRRQDRDRVIELMEGVEDIPGPTLRAGLPWDWETFPEYLDALERMPRTIDVGAQLAHHPLRVYVMGERAIHHERATAADIARMQAIAEEALQAGALGITTSRTESHRTTRGEQVPGRHAAEEELLALGSALGKAGHGAFGMLSDFDDEAAEFDWIARMGKATGRPIWFLLTDRLSDPQRWRRLMQGTHRVRAGGVALTAQVAGRPVGLILGLMTSLSPFAAKPSFAALNGLPHDERMRRLLDPAVRARILDEDFAPDLLEIIPPVQRPMATRWDRMYVLGDPPNYEPEEADSIAAMAARAGQTPQAFCYDYLVAEDGRRMLFFPITNYVHGDHGVVHSMLTDPATLLGLSDGGAHCGLICDSSVPTFMLTHWVRDRSRGPRLPLERVVQRQTSETADFFGLADRGRLQPGLKADINLIDFDRLRLHAPELVHDLPAGGKRLVQRVDGYDAIIVSGVPVFEQGVETGARPGHLVRGGR
jgi:N-acyl-D-aspartate/D-glutamate deacylase